MDIAFYVTAFLIATIILFAVAESDRLLGMIKPKGKKVGSAYWGVYEGARTDVSVGEVQAEAPFAKNRNVLGHATYAAGKGVRMSGN